MLTKDERHMLGAALDVLRHNVLDQPGRRGDSALSALLNAQLRIDVADDYVPREREWARWAGVFAAALRAEWPTVFLPRPERRHRERILRARLALAIRAVLRADRGERGDWWVIEWPDGTGLTYDSRDSAAIIAAIIAASFRGGTVRRREALWTTAPGHEAGR